MIVPLGRGGWSLELLSPASGGPRYSCLLPGSLVLVLSGRGRAAEAVWEPWRCGRRGGWLPLVVRASSSLSGSSRPVVVPDRGRATASLEGLLGGMAGSVGLRASGSVVRLALASFPGDPRRLALALSVMES